MLELAFPLIFQNPLKVTNTTKTHTHTPTPSLMKVGDMDFYAPSSPNIHIYKAKAGGRSKILATRNNRFKTLQ